MSNATMLKFGHPRTLVAETAHWAVQLRPQQPTLGSLVLICKDEAREFSALGASAFADLRTAVAGIERTLKSLVGFQRINYLMLMMVDLDVHFHVIPRYEGVRSHGGVSFNDAGWPGQPALNQAVTLDEAMTDDLRRHLSVIWSRP